MTGQLRVQLPEAPPLELEFLIVDFNGTLAVRGEVIPGVTERLVALSRQLTIWVASADTFGTVETFVAGVPDLRVRRVADGRDKRALLDELGPDRSVAIGNGRNDVALLTAAALGIAVVEGEGCAVGAVLAADLVFPSICAALDALLDPRVLVAGLRG